MSAPIPPTNPYDPNWYAPPRPPEPVNDGLTVTGFVLAFFAPLVGLILSIVAVHSAHKAGRKASGLAVAGIVIGGVLTVILSIIIIAMIAATNTAVNDLNNLPTPSVTCPTSNPNYPFC